MKAVRVHEFGLDHPMKLDEVEDPRAEAGEILIKVGAAGVNPHEIVIRAGKSHLGKLMTLPYIPGSEAAGEVVEVGPGVEGFEKGQRVCGRCVGSSYADEYIGGSYAEYVRLFSRWSLPLPDHYSYAEGAGITVHFLTAWNALVIKGKAAPGEIVLVQAGAGGVGSAAVQLANSMGCRVLATVSSKEKADFCRNLGADETINYRTEDVAARCLDLTDGRGVDLILELVAESNLGKDVEAVAVNGRIVVVGTGWMESLAGPGEFPTPVLSFRAQPAMRRDAHIICISGLNLAPEMPELVRRLTPLLEEGAFKVPVGREVPLGDANVAHELLLSGEVLGKVVLTP
ncbi:zinc-binding alcohol dehydrogenase family protein [Nitrospinota bacterium]